MHIHSWKCEQTQQFNLIKMETKSCLQLPHLMQLHPEVRNILPELQEVYFERN